MNALKEKCLPQIRARAATEGRPYSCYSSGAIDELA